LLLYYTPTLLRTGGIVETCFYTMLGFTYITHQVNHIHIYIIALFISLYLCTYQCYILVDIHGQIHKLYKIAEIKYVLKLMIRF